MPTWKSLVGPSNGCCYLNMGGMRRSDGYMKVRREEVKVMRVVIVAHEEQKQRQRQGNFCCAINEYAT